MDKKREKRKLEHIRYALNAEMGPLSAGWEDIHLVHRALLEHNLEEVDTSTTIFQKKLNMPVIINAMTGGAAELAEINRTLAEVSREYGLGMAVGSQTAGVQNKELSATYKVVREVNPGGLIFANVSAGVKPDIALVAVEMVEADALQLHLNGVQELVMAEGDRQFNGMAENIERICQHVPVPVVVKEVGNGISWEIFAMLSKLGVKAVDTGGSGGTNFASIELARHRRDNLEFLRYWGIPSAASLLEVCSLGLDLLIVASGGITHSSHIMKALALGADVTGISGSFLRLLMQEGEAALRKRIADIFDELRIMMLLTGAQNIKDIKTLPVVVTGFTREWCEQRHINIIKDNVQK